jgi:UDP-glucose 4-epimerase
MKGVLVTGATTPVGRALVRALLDDPAVSRVVAVGLEREPVPRFPEAPRFLYVATDLTRERNLRSLLYGPARDVHTVVHGALHRSVYRIGPRVRRLNVEATRELLEICEEHPSIERLVFQSSAAIYRMDNRQPSIIDERQPLNLEPNAPQWIRDRVEADLSVCTLMGMSPLELLVLRFAECIAPQMGSQLYDYLDAPVCFRPLGFDPMLNLLSLTDMVRALVCAVHAPVQGIYNIPGRDTLPLSELIRRWGHRPIPAPGPLMAPLYRARAYVEGSEFRYDMNHWRFHLNGVLAGERACRAIGYEPRYAITWPHGGALHASA